MSRVVHNLLANAIHHIGPDGCVALRVKPQPDAAVRVEIEDHGAGIAREDLPYIFDKYYRSRADAGKVGTGLGFPSQRPSSSTTAFPSVWTANPARAAFSGSSLIEPDIFLCKKGTSRRCGRSLLFSIKMPILRFQRSSRSLPFWWYP